MIETKIKANGIEIYLKESQRKGATILLLHCSSWNSEQWHSCLPELAKNYHVLAPDMRGHGRSDCPDEGYRLSDFSKDLYELLDGLQIDKVHLVGSSMGAEIALRFASEYPDKVLSLTCEGAFQNFYGPNGEIGLPADEIEADCKLRLEKLRERPIESYETVEEMLRYYQKVFFEERHEAWNECWEAIHLNRFRNDEKGRLSVVFEPRFLAQYCEDFYLTDFAEMYKNIQCPVQFLPDTREASDKSVLKSIEQFRTLVNSGHTVVTQIEGAEHASTPVSNAQGYIKAIQDFLHNINE